MAENFQGRAAFFRRSRSAFGRHHQMAVFPGAVRQKIVTGVVPVLGFNPPLEIRRPFRIRFPDQHQVAQFGGDVVGQRVRSVEEIDFRDPDALRTPLLAGGQRAGIEHAGVE